MGGRIRKYGSVSGSPVKSFFVSMLTRDIDLGDAILDLLDNCVDGILRTATAADQPKPYMGRHASIDIKDDSFMISDNCGGIPWNLHEYAFRMGRADDRPLDASGTVGVYGIGMKRAIFKMGQNCLISSQNSHDRYEVHISPEWLRNDKDWNIPVTASRERREKDGTTIVVADLYDGVRQRFGDESRDFLTGLEKQIATHYAYILDKGFVVTINGKRVKARSTKLMFGESGDNSETVQPFIFHTETSEGVKVFLAVGFTRAIPSSDEATSEESEKKYSSEDAGWTVLCNDRAVLFCDKSELTGWGEATVPRYHTQFIAISGIVEFRSDDPSKLPTTTTKRGIDTSSPLYLQIKNKMRQGMRLFTNFTYKWKGREQEARNHILKGDPLTLDQIKTRTRSLVLAKTKRTVPSGQQYSPRLPLPAKLKSKQRRISFVRDVRDVQTVASYLFNDDNVSASDVGEECFNTVLSEAKE